VYQLKLSKAVFNSLWLLSFYLAQLSKKHKQTLKVHSNKNYWKAQWNNLLAPTSSDNEDTHDEDMQLISWFIISCIFSCRDKLPSNDDVIIRIWSDVLISEKNNLAEGSDICLPSYVHAIK